MALEAPYENWPTSPAKALVDEVNRIAPIPRASMCGRAYLHAHTPPSTLTLTMRPKTLVSNAIKSRTEGSEEAAMWTAVLDRESVVAGKSVSGRVDLGGRRISKKKMCIEKRIE